jgi:nucleoside-diphosphate-sugar epimerase
VEIANPKVNIIGCGNLGKKIGDIFVQHTNFQVLGVRRNPIEQGNFPILAKDIFADDFLAWIVAENPNYIIYSATPSNSKPSDYQKIYVDGLRKITDIIQSNNLQTRVFFISSTRVFNGSSKAEALDDYDEISPNDEQGEILGHAERIVTNNGQGNVFRLTGIYGLERTMMLRLAQDQQSWPANRFTNRIFDEDAANIIVKIISSKHTDPKFDLPKIINVTDSHPVEIYKVLNFIRKKLNLPEVTLESTGNVVGKKIISTFLSQKLNYQFKHTSFESGYTEIIQKMER